MSAQRREWGRLYKQRNSRFWWYRIGFQGRIICASTKTAYKRQAAEVLKRKRQELEAARGGFINMPDFDAKRVTVAELIEALLKDYEVRERRSIAVARSTLKRVSEELGEVRAVDLKTKHLVEYQVTRKRAKAAGGTINREVSLLRRAVRSFLEEQKVPVPRVAPLPENVREGFFNRAEVAAVVQHLPADLHDFVWFGFLTGWRKGEIASLRWADVDEEAKTVRLSWRKSKNKQARTMALEGELAAIIKRQSIARAERVVGGHDSAYVFVRAFKGTRNMRSRGLPVVDFGVVWRAACKKAGLEGRLFHDLRRSAARNMDRAGVSRHVAMQITGHKTESMYRRYSIVTESDIRAALAKTQIYLDTLPATSR
jgi:integrase